MEISSILYVFFATIVLLSAKSVMLQCNASFLSLKYSIFQINVHNVKCQHNSWKSRKTEKVVKNLSSPYFCSETERMLVEVVWQCFLIGINRINTLHTGS